MEISRIIAFCIFCCTFFAPVLVMNTISDARLTALRNVDQIKRKEHMRNATTEEEVVDYIHPNGCICAEIYDPVCASNDQSYYNRCQMECDLGPNTNVTLVHQGNCVPY